MAKPQPAYEGGEPYIYISYSHVDDGDVRGEIAWLQAAGARIWYDVGISTGTRWSDELAHHILGAEMMLLFATPNSAASENCLDEVNFALDNGKKVVVVHLVATELPPGAALRLAHRQAIYRYNLAEDVYHGRLLAAVGLAPDAAPVSSGAPPPPAGPGSAALRWSLPVAAGIVLIAAGAWLLWGGAADTPSTADPEPQLAAAPANSTRAIAVLPFDNLSPDPEDAYFAAGFHDEVLNQLTQIEELSVIARSSVLRYAVDKKPVPEVARELNVGSVMEGSVRYAGDRVRITAQLIDGASGKQLWSSAFERRLEDIFEIQLAIASQIAEALKIELKIVDLAALSGPVTEDPVAYGHYLRALALWGNFQNVPKVYAALDEAIARDPEFAAAWAYLAMIKGFEAGFPQFQSNPFDYNAELQHRVMAEAETAAKRALAIDPNQGYAHMALGTIQGLRDLDREALQRSYATALRLKPNDYFVLSTVGVGHLNAGDLDLGFELFERSMEINPSDAAAVWWHSVQLDRFGRSVEAIERARHAIALVPDLAFGHANLAYIAARAGRGRLARESAARAEARNPGYAQLADIANTYALLGDRENAQRIFDTAQSAGYGALPDHTFHAWMNIAIGDYDKAIDHLEISLEENFPVAVRAGLYYDGNFRTILPIRQLPRYRALVARVRAEVDGPPGDR